MALRPCTTSGISPSFLGLSRSSGQVTHVLLTRSRLCPRASPGSSHHLHVLSTPPAFVLSQDQTLRESYFLQRACHAFNGRRVHKYGDRYDEVNQDHPVRWRTEWFGLKHSAGLLMGLRSARCSVFKDRCAAATGLVALDARGIAGKPQKDGGV